MTQRYICMLRGINVSGTKKIKMDALREMFAESGFEHVQTYIQSGNVIFDDEDDNVESIEKKISNAILDKFGFDVPAIVLRKEEFRKAAENNPFAKNDAKSPGCVYLTFLSTIPEKEKIDSINTRKYEPDEFVIKNKVVYLFCPKNYGQSKLSNTFFENKLKVRATTRNLKTVNELINLAEKYAK